MLLDRQTEFELIEFTSVPAIYMGTLNMSINVSKMASFL